METNATRVPSGEKTDPPLRELAMRKRGDIAATRLGQPRLLFFFPQPSVERDETAVPGPIGGHLDLVQPRNLAYRLPV